METITIQETAAVFAISYMCLIFAHAHTLALEYLINNKNQQNCEVFNLGTGNGVTVLETIKTFEVVSGQS